MSPYVKKKRERFRLPTKYWLLILTCIAVVLMGVTFLTDYSLTPANYFIGYTVVPFQKGLTTVGSFFVDKVRMMEEIKDLQEENAKLTAMVNDLTIENTQRVIEELSPEQVTLYEMRYNRNTLPHERITRQILFDQYDKLYNGIIALGYHAEFGMNTFSRSADKGVSSYLRKRMLEAKAYKGFGISAQSMSMNGISYNILKSCKDTYLLDHDGITEEDVYLLPKEDIAAKYVSVSLYHGQFSFIVLSEILGTDAKEYYHKESEYLAENQLVYDCGNGVYRLTRKGFLYYGAVAALFWSAHHRECYIKDRKARGETV